MHSYDPVPRAAAFVAEAAAHEPRLIFAPYALWSRDETLTFHEPRQEGYVSQSAVNLHDTPPAFDAPARSVASLLAELGADHVDLLKISAEGSEYEILDHILAAAIDVRVLCVEYAQPSAARPPRRLGRRAPARGLPAGRRERADVELQADVRRGAGGVNEGAGSLMEELFPIREPKGGGGLLPPSPSLPPCPLPL